MVFQRQGFGSLRKKKKSLRVQLKTTLRERAGMKTQVSVILKPVLFSLNHVGSSWANFLWLCIHVLYTLY